MKIFINRERERTTMVVQKTRFYRDIFLVCSIVLAVFLALFERSIKRSTAAATFKSAWFLARTPR
jgi:hypothetical protein